MYMIQLKMFGLKNMTHASHSAPTTERFNRQRSVSKPIAIAALARNTMKRLKKSNKRTIHCQSWRSKGRSMALWRPNWDPSTTSPSTWRTKAPMLVAVWWSLRRPAARCTSQTLRATFAKPKAPYTSHRSRSSTRIASKRYSMYQLTSSRADRTISGIIHLKTWQSRTWSRSGGGTKIRNSLISDEKRKLQRTSGSGAWLADAWKQKFNVERNILMMPQTFKKLVASFVPTGRPRIGTLTMTRPSPIAQPTARMLMWFTRMKIGTKSTTACLEAPRRCPSAQMTLVIRPSPETAISRPHHRQEDGSSSWERVRQGHK